MLRRATRAAVPAAVLAAFVALGSADTHVPLAPDCDTGVRLLPQYAANVPGAVTPEQAALRLAGTLGDGIDLRVGDLRASVADQLEDGTVIRLDAAGGLVATALTVPHPAGGWMVQVFDGCTAEVAR